MKDDLVKRLLDDFIGEFPNASRAERSQLFTRLNMMTVEDLELLVSQIKKPDAPAAHN